MKWKNLWASFTISFRTKATDCLLVFSTSAVAIFFLNGGGLGEDGTILTVETIGPLKTSQLASRYDGKQGRGNICSLTKGASLPDCT